MTTPDSMDHAGGTAENAGQGSRHMNRKQRRAEKQQTASAMPAASLSIQDVFAAALQHHQAGRFSEAEPLYRQILAIDSRHAASLHLLGVAAYQTGRHDLAVEMISRAIGVDAKAPLYHSHLGNALAELGQLDQAIACFRTAIDLRPNYPEACTSLANAYQKRGRLDEAVASYNRVLTLRPNHPETYNSLGIALRELGRLDEAVTCFRKAIDLNPNDPTAHVNLGTALREQARWGDAVACYRQAIELRPDLPEAHSNLGIALQEQGRLDEAINCYRQAIELQPRLPEAHSNLGIALQEQGRLDEAVTAFRQAIDLKPDYPEAQYNLGNALKEQGWLDEAVACYGKSLDLKPDQPRAHNNMGNALRELGRLDEAIACYGKSLDLKPDQPEAQCNLGTVLEEQRRLGEAVACYRKAIDIRPDLPEAHNNLAIALLAQGDMAGGWDEYEWRWQTPQMLKGRRDFARPQWRGEAAAGRQLLIHAEQGFGDTLQFCRYAPLAAARGLRVVIEVQPPLARLLRSLPNVDQVIAAGEQPPAFDLHCPMLSLPRAMGTTLGTIPGGVPYLRADAAQVASWRTRLAAMPRQGPRVGLVWAGDPGIHLPSKAAVNRRRSIAPDRLAPLFALPGLHFVSLQKGGPAAPGHFPLTDLMDEMTDFADTAALLATLDLVISVDTAVAHLAAALGKPVWLLDRFDPCWRWLTGRTDSPWYPSLRIYRQRDPGDWDAVITEVARDLHSLGTNPR